MNVISEWRRDTFDPLAFENVPRILPQFEWKRTGGEWRSKQHLNGETDKQGGYVTIVTKERPWNIHHFGAKGAEYANGAGNVEIIKLKALLENTDYNTALRGAARECGLEFPSTLTEEDIARYNERQSEREAARTAMVKALWRDTEEARAVREYLHARKWTDEQIKEAGYGLLTPEMKKEIRDTEGIFSVEGIGTTNRLAIPCWAGERIECFAFRRTDGGEERKYVFTRGAERGGAFFNIGYNEEIVIVEGLLDSLKAKAMGIRNVVAAGGRPSEGQLSDAIKRGARVITLLFDKDAAGDSFIKPAIKTIDSLNAETRVYVGYLPESQDLDEFLTERGVEAYNEVIATAVSAAKWEYYAAVDRAEEATKEGGVTDRVRDELLEEVIRIYASPKTSPQDLGAIREDLNTLKAALNVDSERFEALLAERRKTEAEREKDAKIEAKIGQVRQLFERGENEKARAELRKAAAMEREREKGDERAEDYGHKNREIVAGEMGETRNGIPTGFTFKETAKDGQEMEEKLTLNSGITFICAPRGHGKTSMLNCMALNEAERIKRLNTGESVLYFSYEISRRRLWVDLLKAFVGDPYIKWQDDAIRHFCRNYSNKEERGRYISGRNSLPSGFELPPYECFEGKMEEEFTHKEYFEIMQEMFFADYVEGDILKVIDRNYKVEELLEGIRWHLSHTKKPVSVVFIDYAQLIYSENWTQRREEEIKKVVNQIKDFAEGAGIPFVMAAQFNRQVVSPSSVDTTNIGEGGDFERIADTIIGLYNLKELKPTKTKEGGNSDKETKELLGRAGLPQTLYDKLEPIRGKIFAALLKRRYGEFPLYAVLDFEGKTKRVKQNDRGAAFGIPRTEFEAEIEEEGEFNFFGKGNGATT